MAEITPHLGDTAGAGELPAEHVIHAVGPAWRGGVYGYPLGQAAAVAIEATGAAPASQETVSEARFRLFGEPAFEAFERALR